MDDPRLCALSRPISRVPEAHEKNEGNSARLTEPSVGKYDVAHFDMFVNSSLVCSHGSNFDVQLSLGCPGVGYPRSEVFSWFPTSTKCRQKRPLTLLQLVPRYQLTSAIIGSSDEQTFDLTDLMKPIGIASHILRTFIG